MQDTAFSRKIENEVLLMDGAMGTYFAQLHFEEDEPEFCNLSHPEWIVAIHKDYIEAGANIIRTNTFAINHMLFARNDITNHLVAAVANARQAVKESGKDIFIAGSIGPIRSSSELEEEEVFEEYCLICDVLAKEGIRIFVFETFAETNVVMRIAEYIKQVLEPRYNEKCDIIAQFSVNPTGYSKYGYSMQRIVRELEGKDSFTAVGFNCGLGIAHMNKLLSQLTFTKECRLSILPNAGYEHEIRGRQRFGGNPVYYANQMKEIIQKGANIIGGCCGTTPEYIRVLHELLENDDMPKAKNLVTSTKEEFVAVEDNPFIRKLNRNERVYVVEIDSPFTQNAEKFLEAAYRLKEKEVDLVTISDSPMARPRAEAFEMGIFIADKTGIQVMPHISCRDRNLIGLRSSILGGHINGIRDMLIVTGDPVAREDRNIISSVFDVNSIKLMEYIKNMNQEILGSEPIYYGGALNYAGVNVEAIAERMKKKMNAGCSYFLTQPVYSTKDIDRVRQLKSMTGAKIILGIMPLVSYKNAVYMKNEMAGIDVPEEILEQYSPDMSRKEAENVATDICVAIGKQAFDFADGFYFMTPFNRVALVNGIIDRLRELE